MKTIAYLNSFYARASDSFIRAEVIQLRGFGHTVYTFSIRKPPASELVSAEIVDEHARTDYILNHGIPALILSALLEFLRAPLATLGTLATAVRCSNPGLKGRLWPVAYFFEACYLSRQLIKKRVEHLHDHNGQGCAFVAMLASELSGVPYSLTIHGPGEFDQPMVLSLSDKIHKSRFAVAISEYGRSQLFRWSVVEDWRKIHVVHCGVNLESWVARPIENTRRLVCVGRLAREKGHVILVEAMACLKDLPFFEVVIVGDGPLRSEIEARAKALGVQDRVKITGWMSAEKVREEILASCAMVLPSFAEGLPVVLMEALALERPVITTMIAGIPELVEHGISGWLIPSGSIEDLVDAMRELLAMPADRLSAMGRAGAASVRERHDQTTEARKLQALIEQAAKGQSSCKTVIC